MTVRSRALMVTAVIVVCIALAGASVIALPRCVLFNPTDSAPHGWYLLRPAKMVRAGEFVLARLPGDAEKLASERAYLPVGVPLIKQVAATAGTKVCVRDQQVAIDGEAIGYTLARDGRGRPLAAWSGCRTLVDGELFLVGTSGSASFDSRYFGPVARELVLGRAIPLWTW